MFDFCNRFNLVPEQHASIDAMMGGPGWENLSEEETIALYCARVKKAGGFKYVTSTRIKKTAADRSYFYLIYGTRHTAVCKNFGLSRNSRSRSKKKSAFERKSWRERCVADSQVSSQPTNSKCPHRRSRWI
jgi:hypothetical protein